MEKEFQKRNGEGTVTRCCRDGGASICPALWNPGERMRDGWLELVAAAVQRVESQIGVSRVLPIVLLVALSFSVYLVADVLLEIYRMHGLIVFVAL